MPSSVDPQRLKLNCDEGVTGVLIGFQCLECRVKVFGQATFCQSCASSNLEPIEFSTSGELFSYTIIRVPPAGWPGPVPYILGEIALPEGPHVLAEVVGIHESDLSIGMHMELTIQAVTVTGSDQEKAAYKWKPLNAGPSNEEANQ